MTCGHEQVNGLDDSSGDKVPSGAGDELDDRGEGRQVNEMG